MKKLVLKIGGSLLFNKNKEIDHQRIKNFCDIIKKYNFIDVLVVICGGGLIAREYITAFRAFNRNEALCDVIGIEISKINAKLIIAALGDQAFPQVPQSIEELSIAQLSKKIIIMGGLQPGQSTTSVAVAVAEYINAESLVILTDVDGIYDRDPKKYKEAKKFDKISYEKLQDIILKDSDANQAAAGEYRIFDIVSLQLLKRSQINVYLTSGYNLNTLEKYWNNESKFIGTIISKEGK